MPTMTPFVLDGKTYDVAVTDFARSWQVLDDAEATGRVQSGKLHRRIIGTYYNYDMTISARPGAASAADLDALWELLSAPTVSHVCTFPYNQSVLTQEMYISGGKQTLRLLTPERTHWGAIQLQYRAMEPYRRPV